MTKEEHINYWLSTAEDDEANMNALFDSGRFTAALFFGHLQIEKTCKALWVKNNENNTPPFSHNLIRLLNGIETGLNEDDLAFLDELNVYQLEGRYPDYKNALKQKTTKELADSFRSRIKTISQCLRKKI